MEGKALEFVIEQEEVINNIIKSNMSGKRLTMLILKEGADIVSVDVLRVKAADWRVWTRGDGARYKEFGYIKVKEDNIKFTGRQYGTFKRLFPDKEAILDHVWEELKRTPRAKDLGTLSGEFKSGEHSPALRARGYLWVKRSWGIEFGSMNRLKNDWIWQLTPPEDKDET